MCQCNILEVRDVLNEGVKSVCYVFGPAIFCQRHCRSVSIEFHEHDENGLGIGLIFQALLLGLHLKIIYTVHISVHAIPITADTTGFVPYRIRSLRLLLFTLLSTRRCHQKCILFRKISIAS